MNYESATLQEGTSLDSVAAQVDGQVGAKWRNLNGFAAELTDKALSAVSYLNIFDTPNTA